MSKIMNETEYKANLANKTNAELKYIIKDCLECVSIWFESGNTEYYLKEIEFCSSELRKRLN